MKKKGNIGVIAVVVIALGAAGAYFYGVMPGSPEDALKNTAGKAAEIATDKGKEMMAEHGEDVMDKGKEMAQETIDQAIDDGKEAVGSALQEAGEKVMGADVKPGVFETYSEARVAEYGGAVLDFYAPWCPSCRALEADIKANLTEIPDGVAILKVDFDTATDLRTRYGVTRQHTFVQVDADGTEIQKWSGSPTLGALVSKIQ